jgi:type I restriction enzyme S subunit
VFRNDDDTSYFYYQLLAIRPELESWGQGSTFKELGRSKLESIYLVSPPVKEQRAIAAFLDRETERIDTLIAKKERQIELLKEKRAALISHAVTRGLNPNAKMKNSGIEWLGEIPEHWGVVSLKSVLAPRGDAVKTGPFGSQLLSSEMLSGTIKVYNQRNVLDRNFQNGENYITDEKYADLKAFTIHPGDLLITTRGTIGHCALFPSDAELGILHPCLIRAQPDFRKIIPEYLAMLIQDSFLVKTQLAIMSNATTIDVIYSDSLKRVRLPVPPLLEQEKILSLVGCMVGVLNRLLEVVERSIDKLREYRMTLISAAVTGKIDVRKEVV